MQVAVGTTVPDKDTVHGAANDMEILNRSILNSSATLSTRNLLNEVKRMVTPIDQLYREERLTNENEKKLLRKLIELKLLLKKVEHSKLQFKANTYLLLQQDLTKLKTLIETNLLSSYHSQTSTGQKTHQKRKKFTPFSNANKKKDKLIVSGIDIASNLSSKISLIMNVNLSADDHQQHDNISLSDLKLKINHINNNTDGVSNNKIIGVKRANHNEQFRMPKVFNDNVNNDTSIDIKRFSEIDDRSNSSNTFVKIPNYKIFNNNNKHTFEASNNRKDVQYDDDIDTHYENYSEHLEIDLKSHGYSLYSMMRSESCESLSDLTSSTEETESGWKRHEQGKTYYELGLESEEKGELTEAIKYYQQGNEIDHVRSKCKLAMSYQSGKGINKDYKQAKKLLEQLVQLGDAEGQYLLGLTYQYGIGGIKKNLHKATDLYMLSSCGGNSNAALCLGVAFQTGSGVEQDMYNAIKQYKKSASLGNERGYYNLGVCYERGQGLQHKNYHLAVQLYLKAADLGSISAMCALGMCYERGFINNEINYDSAFNWYSKAANFKCTTTTSTATGTGHNMEKSKSRPNFMLGRCYESGLGTQKNVKVAISYYEMAVQNGCQDAEPFLQNLLQISAKDNNSISSSIPSSSSSSSASSSSS